jgi:hypothetical protein
MDAINIFQAGAKVKSEAYTRYVLCKEFGWTFQEFENQPPFFIEEVMLFLIQENQRGKTQASNLPQRSGGLKR